MLRPRFGLRTLMAIPVVVGLVAVFPIQCRVTQIDDLIPINVPLTFLVVDDSGAGPVNSASVCIAQPVWSQASFSATTDINGCAGMVYDTRGSEGRCASFRVYRCVYFNGELRVSARGYQPIKCGLMELTTETCYHYDPKPPPIVIRLKRL